MVNTPEKYEKEELYQSLASDSEAFQAFGESCTAHLKYISKHWFTRSICPSVLGMVSSTQGQIDFVQFEKLLSIVTEKNCISISNYAIRQAMQFHNIVHEYLSNVWYCILMFEWKKMSKLG